MSQRSDPASIKIEGAADRPSHSLQHLRPQSLHSLNIRLPAIRQTDFTHYREIYPPTTAFSLAAV